MNTETPKDICCPEFNPAPWEDKLLEWYNKPFVKDHVFTLFYMPVNFGKAMKRLNALVESSGATMPDWLCLSDHTSQWNMDLYLAVDKQVNGAENTALSGKFYSRVYEGPFKNTGKWCKEFGEAAKAKGFSVKKLYLWYTTCPKCAKKYGKNWVVIIGHVEG
jgi:hypothetical protein